MDSKLIMHYPPQDSQQEVQLSNLPAARLSSTRHSKMDHSHRPRKRARMACIWCHERKVRCDVSIHGSPCTNCKLDGHDCAIRANSSRGRTIKIPPAVDLNVSTALIHKSDRDTEPHAMQNMAQVPELQFPDATLQNPFYPNPWENKDIPFGTFVTLETQIPRFLFPSSPETPRHSSNVVFSFYRFLELSDLPSLPAEDVKYLELKGCLHVPAGAAMDEFVRQYFLHVHPCLPVIHEGEFWRSYYNRPGHSGKPRTMSLFVFQAMLFASCAFVPFSVINAAGFPDTRTARNILYSRAKLIYDLNAEHNVVSKAQGSVLLTYQSSSVNLHAGSLWLTSAIQNAMLFEAHNYHKLDQNDPSRDTKKRLWWSILLRDRILPLGLRRHLQITPPNFDLSLDCMNEKDMQEEIYCSEVYNVETKRYLATVLNLQCQLAMVLTGVVNTVYAANGFTQPQPMTVQDFEAGMVEVVKIRDDLTQWARVAKVAFGPSCSSTDKVHESVILYSELTYMYYHAARVALCHYETLLLEANSELMSGSHENRLESIKDDLESAALGITKCVKRLLAHGVARHLPISAIAYTALPLVLNALDVKLSGSVSQSAARKRRLRYYAEVMQLYRSRYDGTDDVAVYIREILQFAEAQNLCVSIKPLEGVEAKSSQETRGWAEVFIRQPRFYLRLSLTLDYALARGRYPQDSDLPVLVRELPAKAMSESTILDSIRIQEISSGSAKENSGEHWSSNAQSLTAVDGQGGGDHSAPNSSSPSASSIHSRRSTSMAFNHEYTSLPVDLFKVEAATDESDMAAAAAASPAPIFPVPDQKRRSSVTPSPSLRETSSSPAYESIQDVNLDFFDMGCAQSMGGTQLIEEMSTANDMDWANSMLDEMLNAIPA